jgi:hypothetical protein
MLKLNRMKHKSQVILPRESKLKPSYSNLKTSGMKTNRLFTYCRETNTSGVPIVEDPWDQGENDDVPCFIETRWHRRDMSRSIRLLGRLCIEWSRLPSGGVVILGEVCLHRISAIGARLLCLPRNNENYKRISFEISAGFSSCVH